MVLLEYLDRVEKTRREDREMRMALMVSGALSPSEAFPELAPSQPKEEGDPFPDETEAVTYVFPDQEFDPQSIEEELRMLAAEAARGVSTFEDDTRDWM